jgi:hypothetical protein
VATALITLSRWSVSCAVAGVLGEVFHTGFIYGLFEKWNVDKGTLFFRETLS